MASKAHDSGAKLDQYVVYDHPADHPDKWVVRRWEIHAGSEHPRESWTADTLEDARSIVPAHLVNIGRFPGDDPAIYEVWT